MKQPINKLLLLAFLVAALLVITACGGDDSPADTSADSPADDTPADSVTETESPAPIDVDVSLSVKDQKGTPIADAVLVVTDAEGQTLQTLTTNAEGTVAVTLAEGTYTVSFDTLPEYHLAGSTSITVAEGMAPMVLEVTNNTPDGSEAHPFFINENETTFSFAADTTYYFTMFGGDRRSVVIENPNVELTFNGVTHKPDANGVIKLPLVVDGAQNHINYSVKSAKAQDVTIKIESEPGSTDNPMVAELDKDITVEVPKDTIMYFSYIAYHTGTLTLTSSDAINNISITNRSTSETTNFSAGSTEPITVNICAGDQVSIAVSVIGGDTSAESQTVTFRLVENHS